MCQHTTLTCATHLASRKEGFIRCDACVTGGSLVDCIDGSGKSIGPEEIRGISILHDGVPLVKYPPVCPLCNSILFRGVGDGEFHADTYLFAVHLEDGVYILSPMI